MGTLIIIAAGVVLVIFLLVQIAMWNDLKRDLATIYRQLESLKREDRSGPDLAFLTNPAKLFANMAEREK